MKKEYYLEPIYDYRNSFYKKAIVKVEEDNLSYNELLYSYNKLVAIYTKDKMTDLEQFNYLGYFSQTTKRHQTEFFRQKGLSEKELITLFENRHLDKRESD